VQRSLASDGQRDTTYTAHSGSHNLTTSRETYVRLHSGWRLREDCYGGAKRAGTFITPPTRREADIAQVPERIWRAAKYRLRESSLSSSQHRSIHAQVDLPTYSADDMSNRKRGQVGDAFLCRVLSADAWAVRASRAA
jgi:hypothetical protein